MRRLLIIVMLLASTFSYAQVNLSKEQLRTLPDSVRLAIQKASELPNEVLKAKELSKSASIGREIGEAVNGTLTAIEGSAMRIADSNLGRTAIAIAVWKLLWRDVAGILLGITIFIIGNIYAGKVWGTLKKLDIDPSTEEDALGACVLMCLCYVITCIMSVVVVFS